LFSLFVPFVKNYASSMNKTKNPAKLPYPTCFYLPQSSLMHMVHLQMSHIDVLIDASMQPTPLDRFLGVVKYCMSSWELTKFPYKPIISLLGETAQYSSPYSKACDATDKTYVLAENMRKDPPFTCFHVNNPKHGVTYEGAIDLQPKFKQAHVHVQIKGTNKTTFTNPEGLFREEYCTDIPDFAVRLLRMHTELVGEVNISSSTGYVAKITFKEKSLFGKAKNQIVGKVSYNGADICTVDGGWDEVIYINNLSTSQRMEFMNRSCLQKNHLEALPLDQQPVTSCDRIWHKMLDALVRQDFETAAALKAQINAQENSILSEMVQQQQEYTPRFFNQNAAGMWEIKDPALAINMGGVLEVPVTASIPIV